MTVFTKIRSWFLGTDNIDYPRKLEVGTRVTTPYGSGVISGGTVNVLYDTNQKLPRKKGHKPLGINDKTWTHNLNDLELEVVE